MNLSELEDKVDNAILYARECGVNPEDVTVAIQVNSVKRGSLWADDLELTYDNDGNASGCVLHGWSEQDEIEQAVEVDADGPPDCIFCGGRYFYEKTCKKSTYRSTT